MLTYTVVSRGVAVTTNQSSYVVVDDCIWLAGRGCGRQFCRLTMVLVQLVIVTTVTLPTGGRAEEIMQLHAGVK